MDFICGSKFKHNPLSFLSIIPIFILSPQKKERRKLITLQKEKKKGEEN